VRLLIALLVIACGQRTWRTVDHGGGPPVARAGVRALANRPARCALPVRGDRSSMMPVCRDGIALLAETTEQLADMWIAVGLVGSPPKVDFQRDIVLGMMYGGGECEPTPDAARIDAHHVLTLEMVYRGKRRFCRGLLMHIARVVAIPRSILPAEFVWKHEGRANELALHRSATSHASRGRPTLVNVAGDVALPAPGRIALRSLPDGTQIWVAHHTEGNVAIVRADAPGEHGYYIRRAVGWNDDTQTLGELYDSYGRSGRDYALVLIEHERRGDRVRIGIPYLIVPSLLDGHPVPGYTGGNPPPPSLPSSTPLVLDGPATPYSHLTPAPFESIADGQLGLVDLDLVIADRKPRLCRASAHPTGCPAGAPQFEIPVRKHATVEVIRGPLLVRRTGNTASAVVHFARP
jgi:hypothetical protein